MRQVKVQFDFGCNGFITLGEENMRVLPEFIQRKLFEIGCNKETTYVITNDGNVCPIIEGNVLPFIGNIK